MDDKKKSPAPKGTDETLRMILRILTENPETAESIVVRFKPGKIVKPQHKPGR